MFPPLIVSAQQDWLRTLVEESQGLVPEVLATPSYSQALQWMSNPEVSLSGIFLDPSDPSFSGLRFLSTSLLSRPATPVFIIDADGGLTSQNVNVLSDRVKIQKAFRIPVAMKELIASLQVDLPPALRDVMQARRRKMVESRHPNYWPVPVIDFVHCKRYPFDVFVQDESGNFRFFAIEGGEVDLEYLTFLSQKSDFLFLELSTLKNRQESLKTVEDSYLDPDFLSTSWRSAETLFRAKQFMEDLKKNGVSEQLVEQSYSMMEELFKFMGQVSKDQYLQKFVDQAKQSDRTVACATWSSLMCKKLKFETTSGLESLGMASFLQDISLYNSPFGNIASSKPSELSPSALAYYQQHPIKSAELVSMVSDVPELTKQIIRQHHERPDRTGFPAKVGGAQLQPLSEILSLINAYLDHDGSPATLEAEVFPHYSDRFVSAFKELLQGLGKLG
jgi:hypothetical protein